MGLPLHPLLGCSLSSHCLVRLRQPVAAVQRQQDPRLQSVQQPCADTAVARGAGSVLLDRHFAEHCNCLFLLVAKSLPPFLQVQPENMKRALYCTRMTSSTVACRLQWQSCVDTGKYYRYERPDLGISAHLPYVAVLQCSLSQSALCKARLNETALRRSTGKAPSVKSRGLLRHK